MNWASPAVRLVVAAGGLPDIGGVGDWARALPIANALTAEINASFLSIGGLHWTSSRRQAFTGEGEPPVARPTRNRRACSAKTTSSRGLWAIGGGMRPGNLNVRKPVPDHRRQPFLNLNQG